MKVAILVAGMYRQFETAVKTWTFLDYLDADVYFSTWTESFEVNEKIGLNIHENITVEKIEKNVKLTRFCIEPMIHGAKHHHNVHKMFLRWCRGISLIKHSGIKYDAVIMLRPDLFVDADEHYFTEMLKSIKDGVYYTLGGPMRYVNGSGISTVGINDQMILTTQKTLYTMEEFIYRAEGDIPRDIHEWIHQWFYDHGKVEDIQGIHKSCIIRGNSRGKTGGMEIFNEDAAIWWEAKYGIKY